jgi:tripartite-type tricarboxylate transporter receptor subunit TctC
MVEQGAEPVGNTPAQFAAYMESQIARLKRIAAAAGIKPE